MNVSDCVQKNFCKNPSLFIFKTYLINIQSIIIMKGL